MFFYIYTMKMLEISISMIYGAIEGAIYTNKKGGGEGFLNSAHIWNRVYQKFELYFIVFAATVHNKLKQYSLYLGIFVARLIEYKKIA